VVGGGAADTAGVGVAVVVVTGGTSIACAVMEAPVSAELVLGCTGVPGALDAAGSAGLVVLAAGSELLAGGGAGGVLTAGAVLTAGGVLLAGGLTELLVPGGGGLDAAVSGGGEPAAVVGWAVVEPVELEAFGFPVAVDTADEVLAVPEPDEVPDWSAASLAGRLAPAASVRDSNPVPAVGSVAPPSVEPELSPSPGTTPP
jgi:hypothetical protein